MVGICDVSTPSITGIVFGVYVDETGFDSNNYVSTPSITGIVFGDSMSDDDVKQALEVSTPSITGIVFGEPQDKRLLSRWIWSQPPP